MCPNVPLSSRFVEFLTGVVGLGNSIVCVPHFQMSLGDLSFSFPCNFFHIVCI